MVMKYAVMFLISLLLFVVSDAKGYVLTATMWLFVGLFCLICMAIRVWKEG